MNPTWLPRLLGAATAAYSVAVLVRPSVFLRPTGLAARMPPPALATAARAVAGRDLVSSVAMAIAPSGPALRAAIAVRVGCDASDALLFAVALRGRPRAKAVGVAAGWGVLCGLSALTVPYK
jgi:hypothetical protein